MAFDGPSILVVGSTMTDLIAYADRLPDAGETVTGRTFEIGFGGKGGNQAVMAARLGARVTMVNAVGDDDYGTAYLANLEREGIVTEHMVRVPGPSGVAPIWVDAQGTNRIIIVPGANQATPVDVAVAAVAATKPVVVVGQHEIPQAVTAATFAAARAAGVLTILNPAPAARIATELIAATDWLVPNETEFAVLAGTTLTGKDAHDLATIQAFATGSGISIAVTLGARGVVLVPSDGPPMSVPAPVARAVDTTGAGDAFVGAFAVGLGLGWSPGEAARLGCAMAADSVTRVGTQRSFADRAAAGAIIAGIRPG